MTQMKTPASPWRLHNRKVPDNPWGFRGSQQAAHSSRGVWLSESPPCTDGHVKADV